MMQMRDLLAIAKFLVSSEMILKTTDAGYIRLHANLFTLMSARFSCCSTSLTQAEFLVCGSASPS